MMTAYRRRTPTYFICKKFVFDRAARERTQKAIIALDHAKWHLYESATFENNGMDIDRQTADAWQIIATVSKQVAAAGDRAQLEAKGAQ